MIIGDCSYCKNKFCATHRLPETHACAAYASCKAQAFAKNAAKLEAEKCVSKKVSAC